MNSSLGNAPEPRLRPNWRIVIVLGGTWALLRSFFLLDWGYGPARAGLIAGLAALAWWATRRSPREIGLGKPCRLGVFLLVLAGAGVAIHLAVAGRSIQRSAATESIELDQGQISYRAARYLLDQGVNPYGRRIPLLGLFLAGALFRPVNDDSPEDSRSGRSALAGHDGATP